MKRLTIKELRLVVTDKCPYSCVYCNLYYKKLLELEKISISEFNRNYKIGNESYSLLCENGKEDRILTPDDYSFLFKTLRDNFGLQDVTFSGGDPFLYPQLKDIVNLAHDTGLKTTAITKGAPLFKIKDKASAFKNLGNLSRIIISIDTLDPIEHAENNLPLVKKDKAVEYLPKTLKIIKILTDAGYNIEVNSVVRPCDFSKRNPSLSFKKTKKIINFCLKNGVSKVKFIELDSYETLGSPYIEKYFKEMIVAGYFKKYDVSPWASKKSDKIKNNSVTEIFSIPEKGKDAENMKVLAYRTHCPSSFLAKDDKKKCEFSAGGELHLDFYGRSFLCQRDDKFRFIDISPEVKSRDVSGVAEKLLLINKEIRKQKCKIKSYGKKS